jgi:hypothetical protein
MSRERFNPDFAELFNIARENIKESRRLAQETRRISKETKAEVERLRREAGFFTETNRNQEAGVSNCR